MSTILGYLLAREDNLRERPGISISKDRYELSGRLEGILSLPYVINSLTGNNASIAARTKPIAFKDTGFLLDAVDREVIIDDLRGFLHNVVGEIKKIDELFTSHRGNVIKESKKMTNKLYRAWKGISENDYVESNTKNRVSEDEKYHDLIENINANLKSLSNRIGEVFPEKIAVDGIEIERGVFNDIDFDQLMNGKGNIFGLLKTSLETEIPESYLRIKTSIEPRAYGSLIREGFTSSHIDMLAINLADYDAELVMARSGDSNRSRITNYKIIANSPDKFDSKAIDLLANVMYRQDSDEQVAFKCFVKIKLKKHNSGAV